MKLTNLISDEDGNSYLILTDEMLEALGFSDDEIANEPQVFISWSENTKTILVSKAEEASRGEGGEK